MSCNDIPLKSLFLYGALKSVQLRFFLLEFLTPYFVKLNKKNNMNKELEESNALMVQFEKRGGLVPVVVQEQVSKEVLMLGYANQEALDETIQTRYATFWSTSRNKLWTKGKTSGDYMEVQEIRVDCDQDALVYIVTLLGKGTCHTKDENGQTRKACFYRRLTSNGLEFL